MPALFTRRAALAGTFLIAMLAAGCSGSSQQSFASSQREVIPTNVIGKSDTSGIGPGAALNAPGAGPGATPTVTPTVTPVPSK